MYNRSDETQLEIGVQSMMTPYRIYAESSIGGRSENQDFYSAIETSYGLLLLVCDGMGGAKGGAIASRLAVNTILNYIRTNESSLTPSELLTDVVSQANRMVYQQSKVNTTLTGMGTTIVALLLSDDKATVAHVGDSRLYHIRNKKIIFKTFDHSMVFELVKHGHLTEEEARLSPGSNVILQAVGTKPHIENIEINDNIPFLTGDRFLLCTDGVCGAVPESQLLELATFDKSVSECVINMISTIDDIGVKSEKKHDNLTAIMVEVNGDSKLKAKKSRRNLWLFIMAIVLLALISAGAYICATSDHGRKDQSDQVQIQINGKGVNIDVGVTKVNKWFSGVFKNGKKVTVETTGTKDSGQKKIKIQIDKE